MKRPPFAHRIQIVTGKGGVGKTTVAASLATAYARQGLRTVIAETSGSSQVPTLFGVVGRGYEPVELEERLYTLSITPEGAIEDYVVQQVRFRKLYELVFRNRVMGPFVDAVPGLHDVVQLGKVFDLNREQEWGRPRWDRIIVDAPATGHGLTMLSAPSAMMELTGAGPLHDAARQVHDVVGQPDLASLILVALPEDMPVRETLDLWSRLGRAREQVSACVLNQVLRDPIGDRGDWERARSCLLQDSDPGVVGSVAQVDGWLRKIEQQAGARERLESHLPVPVYDCPRMMGESIGQDDLAALGRGLVHAVGVRR